MLLYNSVQYIDFVLCSVVQNRKTILEKLRDSNKHEKKDDFTAHQNKTILSELTHYKNILIVKFLNINKNETAEKRQCKVMSYRSSKCTVVCFRLTRGKC